MTYAEIDLNVSNETKSMIEQVRRFGMEVMRPIGIALDKLHDPADVIAKGSPLWDFMKGSRELGLHTLQITKSCCGLGNDCEPMAVILAFEQMGYADAGLASSIVESNAPFNLAAIFPVSEMQQMARDYAEDREGKIIGCWAVTEPDHGTDFSLGGADPKCAPSVKAVLKGDEYIVNGEKAAWVSNGTIATHAILHVSLAPSRGAQGQGMAIIPLDLPGISRGKPLDKMGQRAMNQGSIIFEDARIPKNYMVLPDPDVMNALSGPGMATGQGMMGIVFAGLAKAAFDEAYRYSRERIQGGKPLCEHPTIKLKLMNMFSMVEAARASARRMALYNLTNSLAPSTIHAVASKCLSTETATYVASEAMQILGAYGLAKEYPIEKMYRDARSSMIQNSVNEAACIKAMDYF